MGAVVVAHAPAPEWDSKFADAPIEAPGSLLRGGQRWERGSAAIN
jgi:hypothetical protein